MGFTVKQKIDICLKSDANPHLTQAELAQWAQQHFATSSRPSQTTISRILSSKNELVAAKDTQFLLVRRKKLQNQLLRAILTEWVAQCTWEGIPITTPVIQLAGQSIWTRLPPGAKDGNGVFNHKWCYEFIRKLDINVAGTLDDLAANEGRRLNQVWMMDDKVELKGYLRKMISRHKYAPRDVFTIDEFRLFYTLPLDQIFDVSSVDKGLRQSAASEKSLTIMLGCNTDGSEKLPPLMVGSHDTFDTSCAGDPHVKAGDGALARVLRNRLLETYNIYYKANTNRWITSSMFSEYLLTLDHKIALAQPERQILILVDDSSSHRMLNLRFSHIRLCFLKNSSSHNNPYSLLYSGAKFDYLPTSYGIIDEFKTLFRIRQYREMVQLQARRLGDGPSGSEGGHSDSGAANGSANGLLGEAPSLPVGTLEVLSETDYQIPTIKVVEWIWRTWNELLPATIFESWRRTHLLDWKRDWPAPAHVAAARRLVKNHTPPTGESYRRLQRLMSQLNVVIPWEVDDLLGLVNERAKMTLSYVSIEEIVGSCLLDGHLDDRRKEHLWLTDTQIATSDIPLALRRPGGLVDTSLNVELLLEDMAMMEQDDGADSDYGEPPPKRPRSGLWGDWADLDMVVPSRSDVRYSLQTVLLAGLGLSAATSDELLGHLEKLGGRGEG